MWSIYDATLIGFPRTQNIVEAWHRRWETIVGRAHVGTYKIMEELQKEQRAAVEAILTSQPRPFRGSKVYV
jgi:hypothetical protein